MNEPLEGKVPENNMVYRIRPPKDPAAPSVIMLHGLSGDEKAMWVLESALPQGGMIIAPRATFPLGGEGYSWVAGKLVGWPRMSDFQEALQDLRILIQHLEGEWHLKKERLIWMGFSQGAALAFTAASNASLRPFAVIAAAGFLPEGNLQNLGELQIFWGHGIHDEWIPVSRARRDVERLRDIGAHVQFCEADVGHKMGLECLQGLKSWFHRNLKVT